MSQFQHEFDAASLQFNDRLDTDIARLLSESKLTIATAESITGGLISKRLTDVPGSSSYFLGSIICYHPSVKVQYAGALPATIRRHGAVSKDVALELARGVQKRLRTDICISTTGFAGPDSTGNNDVGLVYIGYRIQDDERVKRFHFSGSRTIIREQTCIAALGYLKQWLQNKKQFDGEVR